MKRIISSYERTSVGIVIQSRSSTLVESLGSTSIDFIMIDGQHTAISIETIEQLIRAADQHSIPNVVRLPKSSTGVVTVVLDSGSDAIMIPQVEAVSDIESIASHAKYSEGRSCSLTTRAADFGHVSRRDHVEHSDENVQLIPQIETKAGVENLEEICSLDTVNGVMIGPNDLGLSLGLEPTDPELRDEIDEVLDIARENGCGCGTVATSVDEAQEYVDRVSYLLYGSDIGLLRGSLEESLDSL